MLEQEILARCDRHAPRFLNRVYVPEDDKVVLLAKDNFRLQFGERSISASLCIAGRRVRETAKVFSVGKWR